MLDACAAHLRGALLEARPALALRLALDLGLAGLEAALEREFTEVLALGRERRRRRLAACWSVPCGKRCACQPAVPTRALAHPPTHLLARPSPTNPHSRCQEFYMLCGERAAELLKEWPAARRRGLLGSPRLCAPTECCVLEVRAGESLREEWGCRSTLLCCRPGNPMWLSGEDPAARLASPSAPPTLPPDALPLRQVRQLR